MPGEVIRPGLTLLTCAEKHLLPASFLAPIQTFCGKIPSFKGTVELAHPLHSGTPDSKPPSVRARISTPIYAAETQPRRSTKLHTKGFIVSMLDIPSPTAVAIDTGDAAHPLDNVIWSALTSYHSGFAQGGALARRYPATVAPFVAMPSATAESFAALAQILTPTDQAALCTVAPLMPPDGFEIVFSRELDQMIGPSAPVSRDSPPVTSDITPLGAADVDHMMALIEVAKPGPFGSRTHELGTYLGIRVDGQLAAMSGERMRLDGYTEISAVCADPAYRGRGYPRDLILTLAHAIAARGDVPFLHVFGDNHSAVALYTKLGFTRRTTLQLTVLRLVG
jgi:GNAT superfamily N-acetyltransferase